MVYLPLWKIMEFVSWDDDIPNIWKITHVPNHQSDHIFIYLPVIQEAMETHHDFTVFPFGNDVLWGRCHLDFCIMITISVGPGRWFGCNQENPLELCYIYIYCKYIYCNNNNYIYIYIHAIIGHYTHILYIIYLYIERSIMINPVRWVTKTTN